MSKYLNRKEFEMNIPKAIEILHDLLGEGPQYSPDDRRDAVKLGIEALKAWQESRRAGGIMQGYLLPGETGE